MYIYIHQGLVEFSKAGPPPKGEKYEKSGASGGLMGTLELVIKTLPGDHTSPLAQPADGKT